MLYTFIINFICGKSNRYISPNSLTQSVLSLFHDTWSHFCTWCLIPFMNVYIFTPDTPHSCDYIYSPLCVRVTREIRHGTLTIKARKCILSQFLTRVLKEINMFSLLILIGIISTVSHFFFLLNKERQTKRWNIYDCIKYIFSVFNFDFKEWQTTKFPCFFLLGFFVPLENFSLIWWRAANVDLFLTLMVIEQWGFLSCHTFCDIRL